MNVRKVVNNIIMARNIIKKSDNALFRLLLTLIGCCTLVESSNCAIKCVSADIGCKVCFEECSNSNSTTFFFDSCTQTIQSPSINANQDSNQAYTLTYSAQECGNHCCADTFLIFQNTAITSCPALYNSQTQITIIIISVLTVIFVSLCCLISGHSKIREMFVDWICKQKEQRAQNKKKKSLQDRIFSLSDSITELDKSKGKAHILETEEVCSICLEGSSNVFTGCRHRFHFKCLYEWANRRPQCPLCKQELARVWVHCQKCMLRRLEVRVREVPFLQVGTVGTFKCLECRKV